MDLLTKIWAETDSGRIPEIKRDEYMEKYIFTTNLTKNKQLEAEEDFMGVVLEEREQAFKLEFNTAVKLLFSNTTK